MYKVYLNGILFCDSGVDELAIINPIITVEMNKAGSFTFTVPGTHPYNNILTPIKTLISVHFIKGQTEEVIFLGTCTRVSESIFKEKNVECEGFRALANREYYSLSSVYDLTKYTVETAFRKFNKQLYYVGTNTITLSYGKCEITNSIGATKIDVGRISTYAEWQNKILEYFGGFYNIRNLAILREPETTRMKYTGVIDYLNIPSWACSQEIVSGDNLIKIDVVNDEPDIYSVLIAVNDATEELPIITSIEIPELRSKYGVIQKLVEFKEATTLTELKKLAQQYLKNNLYDTTTIKVTFFDKHYISEAYDSPKPGNVVRLVSNPNSIDQELRVIARTYNLNNPKNDTLTLTYTTEYTTT